MSTSGTVTYEGLLAEIIQDALYTVNAIPAGSYDELAASGDTEIIAHAKRVFNRMRLDWENEGIFLWKVDRTSTALIASTASYALPMLTADVLAEDIFIRSATGQDSMVQLISRRQYSALTDKTQEGRPTLLYVEKNTTNTATVDSVSHAFQGGLTLYPWPVPSDATDVLHYTRIKKLEDATSTGQDVDFTTRYQDALVFGLAWKLTFSYTVPIERLRYIKDEAEATKMRARLDDKERGGVHFKVGHRSGIGQ